MSENLQIIEKKVEILSKTFIRKSDLKILTGLKTASHVANLFANIKKEVMRKLEEEGKILPNDQVVPLELALDYLRVYGVSRKKILDEYDRLKKISKL